VSAVHLPKKGAIHMPFILFSKLFKIMRLTGSGTCNIVSFAFVFLVLCKPLPKEVSLPIRPVTTGFCPVDLSGFSKKWPQSRLPGLRPCFATKFFDLGVGVTPRTDPLLCSSERPRRRSASSSPPVQHPPHVGPVPIDDQRGRAPFHNGLPRTDRSAASQPCSQP
jgi:hypothetical protein